MPIPPESDAERLLDGMPLEQPDDVEWLRYRDMGRNMQWTMLYEEAMEAGRRLAERQQEAENGT